MNWAAITENMMQQYGATSKKGSLLETLQCLCEQADAGVVRYTDENSRLGKIGLTGQIPSCYDHGTDFSIDGMQGRLLGMAALFSEHCIVNVTHDLNSFIIPSIGDLVTEIRMMSE